MPPRTAGCISKFCRVSLAKCVAKGYVLITVVDDRSDGCECSGLCHGRQPAGRNNRCGGAMATAAYLASVRWFLHPVHQIERRDHGRVEEEKASSPRGSAWPGKERSGLASSELSARPRPWRKRRLGLLNRAEIQRGSCRVGEDVL